MESTETRETPDTLGTALERHQITLAAPVVSQLEAYCQMLWEWNEKLNLTRHTTFDRFVSRDIVDTMELGKLIEPGEAVIDVGSGGGVPGLTLAILRPDLKIVLTEPVAKKARALEDMVERLQLKVEVLASRAEEILARRRFDVAVARAVGPLWELLKWFRHAWKNLGRLLVFKGPKWVAERAEARHRGLLKPLELRIAASYPMAGSESESVILRIWPKTKAPPKTKSQTGERPIP